MYWQWTSRQGNNRQSNNDAVAIVSGKSFFFALLADTAEKGSKGAEFARYWAQTIAHFVLEASEFPSTVQLIDYMRDAQKQLRTQYLQEIASYIILIYDKNTGNGWVLHCGDCRLGIMQSDGITWITNVHTLANANGDFFKLHHYNDPSRHILTRCLKARRFIEPDIQKINFLEGTRWLLCTDGYWAEYIGEKKVWEQLSDDASCLEISCQLIQSHLNSDSKNCFNYSLVGLYAKTAT